MKLKIAVIGKSGHALRLIRLVERNKNAQLSAVYHPKGGEHDDLPVTDRFEDVRQADAVIIASPSDSHFEYLKALEKHPGCVLVEKPVTSTSEEAAALRQWPKNRKERTKANFNLRHSALFKELSRLLGLPALGEPVSLDIRTGHGLAFQPKYSGSWRSDAQRSFGPLESVGVHYIHLALSLFGPIAHSSGAHRRLSSDQDQAPDTSSVILDMAAGPIVTLFHSYATPYVQEVRLTGTNGRWEHDGTKWSFFSPREAVDQKGRFTAAPIVEQKPLDAPAMWDDSLKASMDHFITTANGGKLFNAAEFDLALDAMEPVFEARKKETCSATPVSKRSPGRH